MTPLELGMLRATMMLSHEELGRLLRPPLTAAAVAALERGGPYQLLPDAVTDGVSQLALYLHAAVNMHLATLRDHRSRVGEATVLAAPRYERIEDAPPRSFIPHIRLHHAALAQASILSRRAIHIVPFEPEIYRRWLGKRADGIPQRYGWAQTRLRCDVDLHYILPSAEDHPALASVH